MKWGLVLSFFLIHTAVAKDVVPSDTVGNVKLIYAKEGMVYIRQCEAYTIVSTRKDCTAKGELKLMSVDDFRKELSYRRQSAIAVTHDPRLRVFKDYWYVYSNRLSKEELTQIESKLKKMEAYKDRWGEKSVDMERLKDLADAVEDGKKVERITKIMNDEIERVITQISDEGTLSVEMPAVSSFGNELLLDIISSNKNLISISSTGVSGVSGIDPNSVCAMTLENSTEWSCQLVPTTTKNIFYIMGGTTSVNAYCSISSENTTYPLCSKVLPEISTRTRKKKEQCNIKTCNPPTFDFVPVDPTQDEAISQKQRTEIKTIPDNSPQAVTPEAATQE